MAPKSAAALVLLAAMIAGLAPPLQAQRGLQKDFVSVVFDNVCFSDDEMQTCGTQLVTTGAFTSTSDCCGALRKAVTSGEGKRCACGFVKAAADKLGLDVDQTCQAASNGGVAGGPSKLKELCMGAPGN